MLDVLVLVNNLPGLSYIVYCNVNLFCCRIVLYSTYIKYNIHIYLHKCNEWVVCDICLSQSRSSNNALMFHGSLDGESLLKSFFVDLDQLS
jgi:hypothetical protein